MTYFLLTVDADATVAKLRPLLEQRNRPAPIAVRPQVRIEAENFRQLENFTADRRNARTASHRVAVNLAGARAGSIRTTLNQPYAANSGKFDVEVRCFDGKTRLALPRSLASCLLAA